MRNDAVLDKDLFYGRFQSHEDAKNALSLKMAHKALDIPQDDMTITANKTVNHYHAPSPPGGGKLGAAVVAAALAAGTGGLGLGLWQALKPAAVPGVEKINTVLTRDTDVRAEEAIVEAPQ